MPFPCSRITKRQSSFALVLFALKLYGLRSAFCKKKHFVLCPFDIKKANAAASAGKAERAGIRAAAAGFQISYSSVKGGKIFFAIRRRRFIFCDIRFGYNKIVSVSSAHSGNIKAVVGFYCVAKESKRIFAFAGNYKIAPGIFFKHIFCIIRNFRSAKNYCRRGKKSLYFFSDHSNRVYVPYIAGKRDYIRLLCGNAIYYVFRRFVYCAFDYFIFVFFFTKSAYSGGKAPRRKR